MPELLPKLRRLRWRLAFVHGVRRTISALFWASVIACGWLMIARLFPLLAEALEGELPVAGAVWGGAFLFSLVQSIRHWPDLTQAALAADLQLGLRERFTSSLALLDAEGGMVEAVHRDAASHLSQLQARRDFPLEIGRPMKWLSVPLVLFGIGYLFLPEFDLLHMRERQVQAKQEREKAESRAKQLRLTAQALKPPESLSDSPLDAQAKELEAVAEQLERQAITEKQALARVSNLAQQLAQQQQALAQQQAQAQMVKPADLNLEVSKGIANSLQNNRMGEAAKSMRALQEKLKSGKLPEEEKKALAKDLKKLSQMMAGKEGSANPELAQALGELSDKLESGEMEQALAKMEDLQLSMEDIQSALEQLAKLDNALGKLGEFKKGMLGPMKFCRKCGKCLKHGDCKGGKCGACNSFGLCAECSGSCGGMGLGMGGPGRGQGNQVGELPEANVDFDPTKLPGPMTQGKMLASVTQRGAPETDGKATVQVMEGAFVSARQEAEQALTQEEIPKGSKEFVRQYFGTGDTQATPP